MDTLKNFVESGNKFIVAHRGASAFAPENTMSSVELALNSGAAMIETDVQMTKDGVIVAWHDDDLSLKLGINKKISEINYRELKDIDAGSWFDSKFEDVEIPRLEDIIQKIQGKLFLNIEIKEPKQNEIKLLSTLIQIVEKYNYIDKTLFCSFYYHLLPTIKYECEDTHIAAIRIPGDTTKPSLIRKNYGIDAFICSIDEFNNDLAVNLISNNIFSGVYDLLDDESVDRALQYNVVAFASDDPESIANKLKEKGVI